MLEKVLPAVVSVQVEGTASPVQNMPEELKKYFGDNAPQEQAQPFEGLGSGVIIDAAKGYVLTNNHVISQAQKISIQLNDGREFDAKLVGSDEQSDIALLQVLKPSNLTQIAIADSDKLRVGDFAVAVGNPFGLGQTATSGIISALGRSGLNLEGLENFIQTDASINRGNSGGALLNLNGELIGINTAILAPGGGSIGIGFAIPSSMAERIVNQLKQDKKVSRGWIGVTIQDVDENTAKALGLPEATGALIGSVMPDEPAAKGGMKDGDVVLEVNGQKIDDSSALLRAIATEAPGSKVNMVVWRDGERKNITVQLGERNLKASSGKSGSAVEQDAPSIGLSVRPLTKEEARTANVKPGTGLLIVGVEPGKLAAEAELREGDIILSANLKPIKSVEEFSKIIREDAKKRGVVMLQLQRQGQTFFRSLALSDTPDGAKK